MRNAPSILDAIGNTSIVVTRLVDSGLKYSSTDVYKSGAWKEK